MQQRLRHIMLVDGGCDSKVLVSGHETLGRDVWAFFRKKNKKSSDASQ